MDSDDIRCKEINRLAEHARFRLDTTHAPADYSEAIDHCRVRIGSDERIRKVNTISFENSLCQVFEVNLMNDAYTWRYDAEAIKCLSSPFQKSVTLLVPAKFHFYISLVGCFAAGIVDLNRMIYHQID